MMEETPVCQLCLETISNFSCAECLFQGVRKWIVSTKNQSLFTKILEKHNSIRPLINAGADEIISCVKCKGSMDSVACPCCYLYEMYHLFKETDQQVADEFEKHFNYDFKLHHAYSQLTFWQSLHEEPVSSKNFSPITLYEKTGIHDLCDNCGQMSDRIMDPNGICVCESCLEESKIELYRPFSIDFQ